MTTIVPYAGYCGSAMAAKQSRSSIPLSSKCYNIAQELTLRFREKPLSKLRDPFFRLDELESVIPLVRALFTAVVDLDTVYVPIGLGSGICGVIGTRDLLGLRTKIVGVVAEGANTYSRSVAAGRSLPTASALTKPSAIEPASETKSESLSVVEEAVTPKWRRLYAPKSMMLL